MTSFAVSHNTSGRVTIDVYGNLRITNAKSYDGGLLECWIRMKKARAVQFIGIAAQYYNLSVVCCLKSYREFLPHRHQLIKRHWIGQWTVQRHYHDVLDFVFVLFDKLPSCLKRNLNSLLRDYDQNINVNYIATFYYGNSQRYFSKYNLSRKCFHLHKGFVFLIGQLRKWVSSAYSYI